MTTLHNEKVALHLCMIDSITCALQAESDRKKQGAEGQGQSAGRQDVHEDASTSQQHSKEEHPQKGQAPPTPQTLPPMGYPPYPMGYPQQMAFFPAQSMGYFHPAEYPQQMMWPTANHPSHCVGNQPYDQVLPPGQPPTQMSQPPLYMGQMPLHAGQYASPSSLQMIYMHSAGPRYGSPYPQPFTPYAEPGQWPGNPGGLHPGQRWRSNPNLSHNAAASGDGHRGRRHSLCPVSEDDQLLVEGDTLMDYGKLPEL